MRSPALKNDPKFAQIKVERYKNGSDYLQQFKLCRRDPMDS